VEDAVPNSAVLYVLNKCSCTWSDIRVTDGSSSSVKHPHNKRLQTRLFVRELPLASFLQNLWSVFEQTHGDICVSYTWRFLWADIREMLWTQPSNRLGRVYCKTQQSLANLRFKVFVILNSFTYGKKSSVSTPWDPQLLRRKGCSGIGSHFSCLQVRIAMHVLVALVLCFQFISKHVKGVKSVCLIKHHAMK
jgi:hypothetical protein